MPSHRIRARRPLGEMRTAARITDPDRVRLVTEDAAHIAGFASELVIPTTEAEIADILRTSAAVLPIGAQSSLTGGATPRGEVVLSTAAFNRILEVGTSSVRVEAGVTLAALDGALAPSGAYYPPGPTFTGAFVGGTVATNAGGAATFKYGTTRDWVEALTIVLPDGEVLDVTRGAVCAHPDGYFEIAGERRIVQVPVPQYRMPAVAKLSAGYFAAPHMDLIDLFVGAEGTLGIITTVTLRLLAERPPVCIAFVPFPDRATAFGCVRTLRTDAKETWRTKDAGGLDVSAIEHLDARCLDLAREDGVDRRTGITWPDGTAMALLVTLELPRGTTGAQAFAQIGGAADAATPPTPLVRFCRMLDRFGVIDHVMIAVPGDDRRRAQFDALREEVPAAVNRRIGRARLDRERRIEKTAGDMIVPFERLEELLACYDRAFEEAHLDTAVWGHISDGNLHPNVIPRTFAEVEAGRAIIRAVGRTAIQLGGSPLAEHGVGRNRVKQQLLEDLYGTDGIEQMRAVKRAFDPEWKLAPGVLFAPDASD